MGLADDVAYVSILFASIGFGKVFRLIPAQEEGGIKTYNLRRYIYALIKPNATEKDHPSDQIKVVERKLRFNRLAGIKIKPS